jgi:hypothetical protein
MALRILRTGNGVASVVDEAGRELLDLVPLEAAGEELSDLLARLEAALSGPTLPRIVVHYREGLIEAVQADLACQVVLIEEDPFDEPAVTVRRRMVASGDPEATTKAIVDGEQKAARRRG